MANRRSMAIVLGLGATAVGGALILASRAKAEPPPPPPPPGEAEFVFTNLIIEPSEVIVGQPVAISVTVTNIGGESGAYEVTAEIVGVTILTGTGILAPGESESGTLYFTPTQPGAYQVAVDGLSGGFVAVVEITTGFTLEIVNYPAGAVLWNANFAENTFSYDPIADSGWLSVGVHWNYPSDPLGVTTLHIWILDAENNILLNVFDLGPVLNGVNYIFDASTGILHS